MNLRITEVGNENEHRIDACIEPLVVAVKKKLHEKNPGQWVSLPQFHMDKSLKLIYNGFF